MQNDISFVFPNFQGERGGVICSKIPILVTKSLLQLPLKVSWKFFEHLLRPMAAGLRVVEARQESPATPSPSPLLPLPLLLLLLIITVLWQVTLSPPFLPPPSPLPTPHHYHQNLTPPPSLSFPSLSPLFWVLYLKSDWQIFIGPRSDHSLPMSVTDSYLIFFIFFTRAKFLDNKIYTEKRQFFALNL